MKICYITNNRFPSERANSTQVVEMCRAFTNIGHEVSLLVNTRKTHIKEDPSSFYGFKFNFEFRRIYVPDIVSLGKPFFAIATIIYSINVFFFLLNKKFDILYSRNEWVLACLELVFPTQKKVFESHEAKFSLPVRFLFKRKVPCVVISEGIYELYLENGIDSELMMVAHDGIDESFLTADISKQDIRKRLDIKSAKSIALYIGGFDAWKGVETFLKASTEMNGVLFVAIGGSCAQVQKYKTLYSKVMFLGEKPYRDLKYNQKAGDVLVIPNTASKRLSSHYTSPLKLFAHLASEIPLVVSDIPSIRNIVSEKEVYFFTPDDHDSLATKISEVLANPADAKEKANTAKNLSKSYTWDKRADKITEFVTN